MPKDRLDHYRAKRDFAATREPFGDAGSDASEQPRFVVQEHHATRLHWDLRLERDGVLVSFAIPNGIPALPSENRLAVHTEDHPLQYIDFAGEIPAGQYGAGTMTVWDTGTYDTHLFDEKKIEITFHGERLTGRYGLFPIGGEKAPQDWMIHRMDPPAQAGREPIPSRILPMLAGAGQLPPRETGWSFEVKWDGVRAIAYAQPGRLRIESRNLREITAGYPEIRGLLSNLGMREVVLDGEIVAFDDEGKPSFERLQRRMHVTQPSAVRRLAQSTPVVYAIFDLLFLDGENLMARPYSQRREALETLELTGPAWRVPAAHPGQGRALLQATGAQGLEGVMAKRLDSRYEPGRRTGAWIKIKHTRRQELVIGGWIPGEGRRRESIGALLMGHFEDGRLRYAGRVGTGFTERTLEELSDALAPLRTEEPTFDPRPKLPRNAQFARPELVAEIEFREWTSEGMMRAPSFKGLRDDRVAAEVVREDRAGADGSEAGDPAPASGPAGPEDLFTEIERLPDGSLSVGCDGRRLKLSNWDKVLFPEAGFTKGDLIAYYARIAPAVIPHLRDRPLTLKRYPNGVQSPYFYEKNSPAHRPDWVQTVRVGGIDYTLAQDRATLVWLANLADIELHTSLSLGDGPERPTMLVFDLDPGPPADVVQCCEVALVLRGLFAQLGLQSVAKTSGSKGMQVYVPLNGRTSYEQTKPFARRIAELLETRMPELVVSRMTKTLRPGKVLVDWSQNDAHKTTVSVYSVRARDRPTVSAPVSWDEVKACHDAGDASLMIFETDAVLGRVAADGDPFAMLLSTRQTLPG